MNEELHSEWISREITDHNLDEIPDTSYARYIDFMELAEGGGALLHTATDKLLGRRVVVKTLHPKHRDHDVLVRRFIRETRVSAMIQHPNTVPVYEIGRDHENAPYFTMKLVKGHTLKSILDGVVGHVQEFDRYKSRETLIDIVIEIGQALAYAHECGVVHRDVKPSNIRVGDFGEVMVMDWGVAKVLGVQDEDVLRTTAEYEAGAWNDEMTQTGKTYGTPRYMSPEQAKGMREIDARSDVFSLGIILYELLTQRPLFYATSRNEVLNKVINEVSFPPSRKEPLRLIPTELDDICLKALDKDPDKRYISMQTFIEDLQRYRRGEIVRASDYTLWQRMMKYLRRKLTKLNVLMALISFGLGIAVALYLSK